MLSEVQRQKLPNVFGMYDIDQNGYIDLDDFDLLCQKVMANKQLPMSSPEATTLREKFAKRFGHMQQFADPGNPDRITIDQWLAYITETMDDPQAYDAEITGTASFIFSLFDTNRDDTLSLGEFHQYFQSLGLDDTCAAELYTRLGLNDDATVSKDQYLVLLDQFFKSEDPSAPGNILFGR